MFTLAAREMRHRPWRALLLAAGVFVAALSFGLLSSETASSRLQVNDLVRRNFRAAYDILVRPKGVVGRFEHRHHLIDDSFLSGVFGGITLEQYDEIRSLRGVSLAAPVANVGYFLVDASVFVPFPRSVRLRNDSVYRVAVTWDVHHGVARYPGASFYVYYTHRRLLIAGVQDGITTVSGRRLNVCGAFARGAYSAYFGVPATRHGGAVVVRSGATIKDPYRQSLVPDLECASPHSALIGAARYLVRSGQLPFEPRGSIGAEVTFALPVLVAGIDPRAEESLVGLRGAMVSGRYLGEQAGLSAPAPASQVSSGAPWIRTYPVIGSVDTFLDQAAALSVRRLQLPGGERLARLLGSARAFRAVAGARSGRRLAGMSLAPTTAWRDVLRGHGRGNLLSGAFWRVSPSDDTVLGRAITPRTVSNDPAVWTDNSLTGATGFSLAPPGSDDTWYRKLRVFGQSGAVASDAGHEVDLAPSARLVGTFDPSRLRGFSPLSRVPLQTFFPPLATAGDRAARRLLGGSPLGPTTNLGGYLSQPPLLLTTLRGALALDDGRAFAGASPKAPISSIQVRVRGVTGPNQLSLARIKLVAEEIASRTGLTVDITAGSSPTEVPVDLEAGRYGQPPLRLDQGWVKEDVDSAIIDALDTKDLLLIAVLSLACALFIGTAAFAGVRQRRREIAILKTLGWRPRAIFAMVLSETLVSGLLGGALACASTLLIAGVGSLLIPVMRLALIVPVSAVLALIAGAIPAAGAARLTPMDALRPPAARADSTGRVRGVPGLAIANLRRTPGRSLVAIVTLALAVGTMTLVIGIQFAFHGAVAGDVLGQVVSVDVRGVDTVSTLLVLLVAIGGIADVLLTGLRERGRELGALIACGWTERAVTRLVAYEALGLGLGGSCLGAVVGVVAIALIGGSLAAVMAIAVIAIVAGIGLAVLSTALPFSRTLRRVPADLLSGTDE